MSTTEKEFDLGNYPKEELKDEVINDLLGAIEVLEDRGWTGRGWRRGQRLCILNAVTAAKNGGVPQNHYSEIPHKVLGYLHKAIFKGKLVSTTTTTVENAIKDKGSYLDKAYLAGDIMGWNDGAHGVMKRREPVIKALKDAIELRKGDLKKS